MLRRPVRDMIQVHRKAVSEYFVSDFMSIVNFKTTQCRFFSTIESFSPFTELPRTSKKCKQKPMVISVNELKRQARRLRKEKRGAHEYVLKPPENGLLVKELVPIAHEVYACRAELVTCISRVLNYIPMYSCSLCGEVHVGDPPHKIRTCSGPRCPPSGEHQWQRGNLEHIIPQVGSFHLHDRVGRAVFHEERLQVDRIPAVTELCIQAGLDIPGYPTRRRNFPVYSVYGKTMDFERSLPREDYPRTDFETRGFWKSTKNPGKAMDDMGLQSDDFQGFAIRGMEAWERLRSGASKLMRKYGVLTCGYCSEVQVGPRGHKVRNCQAFKHQMRDGQHAWQIATVDDLIPPVYVWHGQKLQVDGPLVDRLKRYYGKLPAVVELFAQAGAPVGESYTAMMRDDIAVPGLDEEKLVV